MWSNGREYYLDVRNRLTRHKLFSYSRLNFEHFPAKISTDIFLLSTTSCCFNLFIQPIHETCSNISEGIEKRAVWGQMGAAKEISGKWLWWYYFFLSRKRFILPREDWKRESDSFSGWYIWFSTKVCLKKDYFTRILAYRN